MDRIARDAASIGALAEPVRRDLYDVVVGAAEPVSREQAAEALGIPVHTARFHLDRLVDDGLLEVEFRRLSGRTGPGAGRPTKLYRRTTREVAVSLPERHYELVGGILATGVERAARDGVAADVAVRDAGEAEGRRAGAQATGRPLLSVLAEHGYEPREGDGDVVLVNCPFDAMAREHTELVCEINEAYVSGIVEGLGCADEVDAVLDPGEGRCCVRVRRSAG
jgi:predicted ArsR family transcriptional regulator